MVLYPLEEIKIITVNDLQAVDFCQTFQTDRLWHPNIKGYTVAIWTNLDDFV